MSGLTQTILCTTCAMMLALAIHISPALSADEPAGAGSAIPESSSPGTSPADAAGAASGPTTPATDAPATTGSAIPSSPTPGTAPSATAAPATAPGAAGADVAALSAKLQALEQRIAELEKNKNTIVGDLFVVNKEGNVLFHVGQSAPGQGKMDLFGNSPINFTTDENGGGQVKIEGANNTVTYLRAGAGPAYFWAANGNNSVAVVDAGNGMQMQVTAPDASAVVGAEPGEPNIRAMSKAQSVVMGRKEATFGFFAVDGSGKPLASLDDSGGGSKYALKVNSPDGGSPVMQAGYHKSGIPGFSLWKGESRLAQLQTTEDGAAGVLELMKNNNITALLSADDGGVLSFLDESVNETVSIGRISENTNGMRVRDGSDTMLELAGREKSGQLTMSSKNKVASILSADEGGSLVFFDENLDETTTFGTVEGIPGMRIRDKGKNIVELAGRPDATGLYINKDDKLRSFVGLQNDGKPTHAIFDENGRLAEMTQEGTSGSLLIYNQGKITLSTGPTEEKPIPAFRAWKDGKMRFAAGASDAGGVSVVYNNSDQLAAAMEGYSTGGGKVYVVSDGKEVASINSTDKPGHGTVIIRTTDGKPAAVMTTGKSGGGNFTAMDTSGAGGVASLGYTPGGPGTVCVIHKGTQCLGLGLTGLEGFH